MSLYASDVLEPLLEASATRRTVRHHCARELDRLEPKLQHRLLAAAHYVGGKCMGYPAIWLLRLVLEARGVLLDALINRSEPALSLSLTTSIVDDLMDRDAAIDEEHVAMLYLLMSRAAFGNDRRPAAARTQADFLSQALEVCSGSGEGPQADDRRGDRIGHFYRMIAAGPALAWLSPAQASILVEATGRFGRFCAHLDDWIDLESDRARGEESNVALRMLRRMRKTRGGAGRIKTGEMGMLTGLMGDLLTEELYAVRSSLVSLDATSAVASLDRVIRRVPGCLVDIRVAQHPPVEWMVREHLGRTV